MVEFGVEKGDWGEIMGKGKTSSARCEGLGLVFLATSKFGAEVRGRGMYRWRQT